MHRLKNYCNKKACCWHCDCVAADKLSLVYCVWTITMHYERRSHLTNVPALSSHWLNFLNQWQQKSNGY